MDRTTVYIPLFPAVGAFPRARVLAVGFEPSARRHRRRPEGLGTVLDGQLARTRGLLGRSADGAGRGRCRLSRLRASARWQGLRALALEPIPDLVDCTGAGLGLALALALGPAPAGGRHFLAFGCIEPRGDALDVVPLDDLGPVLDLLEQLGPQPRPVLCLIAAPLDGQIDAERVASLARANLHCHWVDRVAEAVRICGEHAADCRSRRS